MKIKNKNFASFEKTLSSEINSSLFTPEGFNKALNILDDKLNALVKNYEYYDIVKITQTVDYEGEFSYKLSQLLPYEALVINSDSFTFDNKQYARGDVVLKLPNGENVHIESSTSGLYYPKQITKDKEKKGVYDLVYEYSSAAPSSSSSSATVGEEANLAKTITFTGLQIATQDKIYGFQQDVVKGSVSVEIIGCTKKEFSYNGQTVVARPIIKFYTDIEDSSQKEEVITDYKYEFRDKNLVISGFPNIVTLVVVK